MGHTSIDMFWPVLMSKTMRERKGLFYTHYLSWEARL